MSKKVALSVKKQEQYQSQAEMIQFLRKNPVIACEELLGIQLIDSQAWVLQNSWNAQYNIWTCSRGFGKSLMLAIIAMLKLLLYPDIGIYIISSTGAQAKETFEKLRQIAEQRMTSMPSIKDIFYNEIKRSVNSDGFIRDPASFRVEVKTGGTLYTLNSNPDNIRGKRANIVMFDESAFCSDELITAVLPFVITDSKFKTSTEEGFDVELIKKPIPNQVFYASSAGDIDSKHAQEYRSFSKKMIIGDTRYFAADIPCDIPLRPMIKGEYITPLFTQEKIDQEMSVNPDKAMREYYNKFEADIGENQVVKWADIRRNETFLFPQLGAESNDERFLIAFDPARTNDNSIIGVMKVYRHPNKGLCGKLVNMINLVDVNKRKKQNLKFQDQKRVLQEVLVAYSTGDKSYYNGIERVFMDTGAGGHGTTYADGLLEDWVDSDGVVRPGIIDKSHPNYNEYSRDYDRAKDILTLVNPSAMKNQMIVSTQAMIKSDFIEFPKEYDNKGFISYGADGASDTEIKTRELTVDESIALVNLDILKTEATSMEDTGTGYRIMRSKQSRVGDDRFDVLAMLGYGLHELRKEDQKNTAKKTYDYQDYFFVRKARR